MNVGGPGVQGLDLGEDCGQVIGSIVKLRSGLTLMVAKA